MIQSILLFTLRPGVTDAQVEALRAALAARPPHRAPGTLPDPDLSPATAVSRRLVG